MPTGFYKLTLCIRTLHSQQRRTPVKTVASRHLMNRRRRIVNESHHIIVGFNELVSRRTECERVRGRVLRRRRRGNQREPTDGRPVNYRP